MITPPGIDRDLSAFLDKVEELPDTLRWKALDARERYYEGRQYAKRRLDGDGYEKENPTIYGYEARTPPWAERDPGMVWNLRQEHVQELTDWGFTGKAFCALEVADDEEAADWLHAVNLQVGLPDVTAKARNYAGSQGDAIMSFGIRNGAYFVEAHNPKRTWVLAWRDESTHRPAKVVKVYRADNPFAKSDRDLYMVARFWTEDSEVYYRRIWNETYSEWEWQETGRAAHPLGFCPVYWHPSDADDGHHDGRPDGQGAEGEIDEANYLFAAATLTTKRNADDTLVVTPMPGQGGGPGRNRLRKGSNNVIFAQGAEYLTQTGESATVCITMAEKLGHRIYRRAGLDWISEEEMGKMASGEAMRRRMQRTMQTVESTRAHFARGLLIPLAQGILAAGRILGAASFTSIPPRVETKDDITTSIPRTPGKSSHVSCAWPEPCPLSAADKAAIIAAVGVGVTAKIISVETAVRMLVDAGVHDENVEAELRRIHEDGERAAELGAMGLGLEAEAKGASGEPEKPTENPGEQPKENAP